ncbi:MAG: Hsp20/alpha crystallin family protein [Thermoproteota archaeon]|nr:MAG: Hsp20/alpha crystallin family protein [Candidatus Korarchaeota archaeon]
MVYAMSRGWFDPFEEVRRIWKEMDRMFSELLSSKPAELRGEAGYRQPLADVYETDRDIVVVVEVPGVDKKDVKINATENAVEIRAESAREEEERGATWHRRERRYIGFYRRISLPAKVDPRRAKARFRNGVLEIRLPKVEEARGYSIEIE